jgi:hypothetical protein
MWGKIFVITTGLLSFFYFVFPQTLSEVSVPDSDILGIRKINAQANRSSVESALTIYCLNDEDLPENLNELYKGYLDDKIKIDLNQLFDYKIVNRKDCDYTLQPK